MTEGEREQLAALMTKVAGHRIGQGKAPLECVVVESDWPIYEATWAAVEQMAPASNCSRKNGDVSHADLPTMQSEVSD